MTAVHHLPPIYRRFCHRLRRSSCPIVSRLVQSGDLDVSTGACGPSGTAGGPDPRTTGHASEGRWDEESLDAALVQLARIPQLLVACDYDGTIAPIVDDPRKALPRRETVVALRTLAGLPQTHVAVISGRSLRDLAALSRLPPEVHLVGSHGSEFDVGFATELPRELRELRATVRARLEELAEQTPGAIVEAKPAALAFHYRRCRPEDADRAMSAIERLHSSLDGVHLRHGSKVVELLFVDADKGSALEKIRHQVGASAVLFIGDDLTDEDAFATLRGPDVGVKVGEGETKARFRVADTLDVARILARLCDLRCDWLAGSDAVPIQEHAMLSDQRTAALVTPDGRITWMCLPRIDSAAIFAEIIGGPSAGYFHIRPAEAGGPVAQRYLGATLLLETRWPRMTVLDYLDCSGGRPGRLAGRTDLIRVVEGRGTAVVEFAPRLDFGREPTRLAVHDDGVEVLFSGDLIVLRAPGVRWRIVDDGPHQTAVGEVQLVGVPVVFELRCGTANLRPETRSEEQRRAETARHWSEWAARLRESPIAPELVLRSALTLKGLCYGPTGAIVAAATMSLPEHLGGVRNWDYRYCWLRDASIAAMALARLGSHDEGMQFLDWVLHVLEARDDPERLHPVYNVAGRHLPPEADITELSGYAGSRPVRVGNAAERQVQLDVFGTVVSLVCELVEADAPLSGRHWHLVQSMVEAVKRRWREPDHGIWEIRKPPRQHVYSKVMCWVTAERSARLAEHFTGRSRPDWQELADTIRRDVLENGWKPHRRAFTAAYEGDDLDAACLAVGLEGLVEPDDERFLSTIEAIESELLEGFGVRRYVADDGLPGTEGAFNLMTSWLIDAYHLVGRVDDARELFTKLTSLVGQTGLLPEECDQTTGRGLGNHPQAYSHAGIINNALRLGGLLES
ncbi:MAG: trehalose-phosphatase [Acidimicrobiales bacterium]|nr:MAG: trehalose-phosphatase [Acidimicrobiales bacterium]